MGYTLARAATFPGNAKQALQASLRRTVGAVVAVLILASITTVALADPAARQPKAGLRGPLTAQSAAPLAQLLVERLIVTPHPTRGGKLNRFLQQSDASQLSALAAVPMTVERKLTDGSHLLKLAQPITIDEARALSAQLQQSGEVQAVEPDLMMQPQSIMLNDPAYAASPGQWHYLSPGGSNRGGANIPAAWDVTLGSGSVNVAVVDTGYRPHVDLRAMLPGYDFISTARVSNDGNGRDSDASDPGDYAAAGDCGSGTAARSSSWHGTHVTGTIAALMNNGLYGTGIAPNVRILPVRVLGRCGGYTSDIVDGIRWAAGIDVAGMTAVASDVAFSVTNDDGSSLVFGDVDLTATVGGINLDFSGNAASALEMTSLKAVANASVAMDLAGDRESSYDFTSIEFTAGVNATVEIANALDSVVSMGTVDLTAGETGDAEFVVRGGDGADFGVSVSSLSLTAGDAALLQVSGVKDTAFGGASLAFGSVALSAEDGLASIVFGGSGADGNVGLEVQLGYAEGAAGDVSIAGAGAAMSFVRTTASDVQIGDLSLVSSGATGSTVTFDTVNGSFAVNSVSMTASGEGSALLEVKNSGTLTVGAAVSIGAISLVAEEADASLDIVGNEGADTTVEMADVSVTALDGVARLLIEDNGQSTVSVATGSGQRVNVMGNLSQVSISGGSVTMGDVDVNGAEQATLTATGSDVTLGTVTLTSEESATLTLDGVQGAQQVSVLDANAVGSEALISTVTLIDAAAVQIITITGASTTVTLSGDMDGFKTLNLRDVQSAAVDTADAQFGGAALDNTLDNISIELEGGDLDYNVPENPGLGNLRGNDVKEFFVFFGDVGDVVIGGFTLTADNPELAGAAEPYKDMLDFRDFGWTDPDQLIFEIDNDDLVIDFKDDALGSITLLGVANFFGGQNLESWMNSSIIGASGKVVEDPVPGP
jgi:serine protease